MHAGAARTARPSHSPRGPGTPGARVFKVAEGVSVTQPLLEPRHRRLPVCLSRAKPLAHESGFGRGQGSGPGRAACALATLPRTARCWYAARSMAKFPARPSSATGPMRARKDPKPSPLHQPASNNSTPIKHPPESNSCLCTRFDTSPRPLHDAEAAAVTAVGADSQPKQA
jgi:hypothetical protein